MFHPIQIICGTGDVDSSVLNDLSFVNISAEEAILYWRARGNSCPYFSHVLAYLAQIPYKIYANNAGENVWVLWKLALEGLCFY